jgi:hypothetical protein
MSAMFTLLKGGIISVQQFWTKVALYVYKYNDAQFRHSSNIIYGCPQKYERMQCCYS